MIHKPKTMAHTINALLSNPVVEKDNLIRMVEIIKPEFRITLWNSSVRKKENNNKKTSAKIKTVKNCSKKMLLMLAKELVWYSLGCKPLINQLVKE
ncbi:MAG: hypothetical protein ACK4K0_12895 [Flavobacteriales bacterium]